MKRGSFRRVKCKILANIILCILIFFPCLMTSIANIIVNTVLLRLGYAVLIVIFGLFSIQTNGKIILSRKQYIWLLVWVALFVFMVLNNNGDIAHRNLTSIIYWGEAIFFSLVIVMSFKFNENYVMQVIWIGLSIQMIAGFYFWIFPNQLMIFSNIYNLSGVWLSKFERQVQAGYLMGLVTHYSQSGIYMAMGTILSVGSLLADRIQLQHFKWKKIVLCLAFMIALILTGKRGQLLFALVSVILMYFVGYINGNLKKKINQFILFVVFIILALVIVLRIPAFSNTLSRFIFVESMNSSALNEVSSNRVEELWIPAIEAFQNHKVLGIGWRQFMYQFPTLNGVQNDCHNIYIQLLCENGLIGFVLFLSVILYTYILAWKSLLIEKNSASKKCYTQLMFAFGYQTFFVLYGFTGNPLYDIYCLLPYMFSCGLIYKYREKNSQGN